MTAIPTRPEPNGSHRDIYVADRPIDFETWASLPEDLDTELIKGV